MVAETQHEGPVFGAEDILQENLQVMLVLLGVMLLAAAGVDLTAVVVVAPSSRRDALWASEQALRSGSCHALAAWLPKPRYAELQRLAVAAEASGSPPWR